VGIKPIAAEMFKANPEEFAGIKGGGGNPPKGVWGFPQFKGA